MAAAKLDKLVRKEGQRTLVGGRHVHAAGKSGADVVGGRLTRLDVGVGDLDHRVGLGPLDHLERVPVTAAVWVVRDRTAVLHHGHDLVEVEAVRVVRRALEHVDDAGDLPVETVVLSEFVLLFDQEFGQTLGHGAESDKQQTHMILRQSLFLTQSANRSTASASCSFDTKEKLIRMWLCSGFSP